MDNKKGNAMVAGLIVVGIFAILGLGVYGLWGSGAFSGDTQSVVNSITTCDSTTTPNLSIKAYDKENIGTALTEGTNLYRIKGEKTWTAFTAGTAFATNVGDELEIVMGIDTTDFTDNAYGQKFEYTVPCEETPSVEYEMANDEIETSLTATFYNADGDAGAETFSTGETQTVSIKLKAGTDEYFGNPYVGGNTNVLCLALNSTTWDKPEQVYLADGTELGSTNTPNRHSATAGKIDYCYEIPVVADKTIEVFMDLNADDTTAPAVDDTASMYAGNWFLNGDTSEIDSGVENEEDAAVGTDAADTVTLDFT